MNEATKVIELMGTKIRLYFKGEQADRWLTDACAMLKHYEQVFSANSEQSQLHSLKTTANITPVAVDHDLYELIKIGKEHSLAANSFLNIPIGPLIKLWCIGFNEARVPSQTEIQQVLEYLDPADIVLDDERKRLILDIIPNFR